MPDSQRKHNSLATDGQFPFSVLRNRWLTKSSVSQSHNTCEKKPVHSELVTQHTKELESVTAEASQRSTERKKSTKKRVKCVRKREKDCRSREL